MKVCLVYPNLDGSPQSLDMGVAYLATYLDERTPHEVKIVDPTFHKRKALTYIREQINAFRPDVVGISVVSLYFDYARRIARDIKDHYNVPIIAGGFHAVMMPEETIAVKEFDAVCTGDGEYTITEYLDKLESGGDLRTVKGLFFKEDGRVIKNEKREHIANLDDLPTPNYDLFDDIDKYLYYLQRLYVIGSRGCPYNCSFCAESVLCNLNPGKRFRERDPVKYVEEIDHLYKKYKDRGMKAAHLYEAVFTFNNKWFRAWAEEYQRRGLHKILPYSTFLKADRHNASPETIRLLAESGCRQVRIGIESGDDEIRESVINKKGSGGDVAWDVIRCCNKYGIIVKTYAIFGIPGDTKESIYKTYRYCASPFIHIPLLFSYTPLPNTPLAQRVKEMNECESTEKMYSFHYSKGAKNEGVPLWYVPMMITRSYLHFGLRLIWATFVSNPLTLIPRIVSRFYRGLVWGCPALLTVGYALISPEFWPGLSKRIRNKWKRSGGETLPLKEKV